MGFRVPTVTQADIEAFRESHFVSGIGTAAVQFTRHESSNDVYPLLQHDEEEDNLGCYPDGVKRTLTDEQISMFRHSEIYSLLRKRQLQKENQETDGDASTAPQIPAPALTAIDNSLEEVSENQTSSYDFAIAEETRSNTVKRQKRHKDGGTNEAVETASPSRRQIRELDGTRPLSIFLKGLGALHRQSKASGSGGQPLAKHKVLVPRYSKRATRPSVVSEQQFSPKIMKQAFIEHNFNPDILFTEE
ncbi:MAG: hypothetical protein LQ346_003828 [Caloplaca aetnensis]|nr:MAG: hypothetical protein LQ346_003828 [Caloplaca aetnensis]